MKEVLKDNISQLATAVSFSKIIVFLPLTSVFIYFMSA